MKYSNLFRKYTIERFGIFNYMTMSYRSYHRQHISLSADNYYLALYCIGYISSLNVWQWNAHENKASLHRKNVPGDQILQIYLFLVRYVKPPY